MRDFTLHILELLCTELQKRNYRFITFADYCSNKMPPKFVILRHDVDRDASKALEIATLENGLTIRASYYFRMVRGSYNEYIIKEIANMDHECGYHYEDLSLAKGNNKRAIKMFEKNLRKFRQLCPVRTICMHGSPLSKWDNCTLWQHYDYRDFDIIGEPYFDIDFNKVLYLTDTGRRWDGSDVSVRDKVQSEYNYKFRSTVDIIDALDRDELPNRMIINAHPHRWTNKQLPWLKELILQNIKNIGKWILVKHNQ